MANKAKIVAIPNPGKDHSNLENYRLISLLSCIGKLSEKVIALIILILIQTLTTSSHSHSLVSNPKNQQIIRYIFFLFYLASCPNTDMPAYTGFRDFIHTYFQIHRLNNYIIENRIRNRSTGLLVLLGTEKAFDSIWHDGLVYKLIQYNFPTYLSVLSLFLNNSVFSQQSKKLSSYRSY